jgi:DNA-binding CsgD family transcriptional regulator
MMSEHVITRRAALRGTKATAVATAVATGAVAEITPEQERALALMSNGKTAKEAAAGAGVSRATLYRWLRDDPAFVAAWNAWQRDQRQATRAQLLGMTGEAVDAVRAAVQKGDGRLALAMLKAMGLLTERSVGSEDVELVGRQLDLARREELLKVQKREFSVMIDEMVEGK